MADSQNPPPNGANFSFGAMSDAQLQQTMTQLAAAGRSQHFQPYASPAPQAPPAPNVTSTYLQNIRNWSTSTTPPPRTPVPGGQRTRTRATRSSNLAPAPTPQPIPQPTYSQVAYQPPPLTHPQPPLPPPLNAPSKSHPRAPLPTQPQALVSTYASRLRTGATLLMQPILSNPSEKTTGTTTRARRGGAVNYADPGSGDEIPDAGALDSDDSDFVASGGTRTALRAAGLGRRIPPGGVSVFHASGVSTPLGVQQQQPQGKAELDQSYLGLIPPQRFIVPKSFAPTKHDYFTDDVMEAQAKRQTSLIPIRVEFETDTHRIRDCFVWNLRESLITPEAFARIFCTDLDLPHTPWAETVANQIRAQIEDHETVATMDVCVDEAVSQSHTEGDELPECRVVLALDVQIGTHHLRDHIEWDLLSPLTPEAFSQKLCAELGLSGEAIPLVAHAIHEEILKHKKDAIEWGVIGGEKEVAEDFASGDKPRDKSGLSLLKDKTGLGLAWGRAPKDGRGPKVLKSVWRDWAEAEEFRTRFEVLSAEEVERREIEKERASRRLRRETSKFQSSLVGTRRRR
ncbi:hypothetical protein JAAARDRAFT_66294 [Jaapia argillacea MUCL 33604]|uniref:SNF5-domain-containing protein n=1 Tax=Jaapia argillacea MUCL 33604 TaxID=933084 RepID=A0A067QGG1_9AGAM|nr:hypothetical protein JAAARDRAFT_66294 [Jaapia argillacea MUCL 33604]